MAAVSDQDGPRLLVAGGGRDAPAVLDGHDWSHDPNRPFDIVVALPGVEAGRLFTALARLARLPVPVVDLTDGTLDRSDWAGPATAAALTEGLSAVAAVRRRLADLADPAIAADAPALQILALAHTRDREVAAAYAPDTPDLIRHPLLTGLATPRPTLEVLADAGLLRRRFFDRVHVCPHCDSARLNAREECAVCRTADLDEVPLIHHYRCAHQGPEAEFAGEGASLVCPKCRHVLRHYGVDYDRPGTVFVCAPEGHVSPEPAVGFMCADCGHHVDGGDATTRDWFHYALTPAGATAARSGQLPHTSLDQAVGRLKGAVAPRDFAVLVTRMTALAARYDRPLSAVRLRFGSLDAARQRLGASRLDILLGLVGQSVAREVRETDAVVARADEVQILLPETGGDAAHQAVARLRAALEDNLAGDLDLDFAVLDGTACLDLLEGDS